MNFMAMEGSHGHTMAYFWGASEDSIFWSPKQKGHIFQNLQLNLCTSPFCLEQEEKEGHDDASSPLYLHEINGWGGTSALTQDTMDILHWQIHCNSKCE